MNETDSKFSDEIDSSFSSDESSSDEEDLPILKKVEEEV